jgi:hypothetical protein
VVNPSVIVDAGGAPLGYDPFTSAAVPAVVTLIVLQARMGGWPLPVSGLHRVLLRHARAELDVDVDAVMATVAPQPSWLIHPLWRMNGVDAVRETYRRALSSAGHGDLSIETMTALEDPDVTTWGTSFCLVEYSVAPDRYPLHDGMTLSYHFSDDLVVSERVYLSRPELASKVFSFYGADFGTVAGVTALS